MVTSPVLNVRQAAAYIGVSRATLYALMDKGDIKSVQVSERRRVLRITDLDDYLERRTSAA